MYGRAGVSRGGCDETPRLETQSAVRPRPGAGVERDPARRCGDAVMLDLTTILARQRAFSLATFGPDYRPQQAIDHIVRDLTRDHYIWRDRK